MKRGEQGCKSRCSKLRSAGGTYGSHGEYLVGEVDYLEYLSSTRERLIRSCRGEALWYDHVRILGAGRIIYGGKEDDTGLRSRVVAEATE